MTDTIESLLHRGRERLAGSDSPQLDAEILLARAMDKPRSYLVAWPERCAQPGQQRAFEHLLERRARGEPMAYIMGEREFWSLSLDVNSSTLVPRPDTELLVERALEIARGLTQPRVADLGTGSGAIALALAAERADADVVATDISPDALAVARRNARKLALDNVTFAQGDWVEPLGDGEFDLIVSNPPYVVPGDPVMDRGDLAHEPRTALEGRGDGLDDARRIAADSLPRLRPGGWLLLEHGDLQAATVAEILGGAGYESVATWHDLGGRPRVTGGRRPAPPGDG